MPEIEYSRERTVSVAQFIDVLERSTLAARRPVGDRQCLQGMLDAADLLVTAWRGDALIGVARSVTDFTYCCYLSDLAVDLAAQRQGVGRTLVAQTRAALGPRCSIILLAAPAARDYYPRLGFEGHDSAWILGPES